MGSKSRSKGKLAEQEVVRLCREHGLQAQRTWYLAQSPDAGERVRDVRIGSRYYQVQIDGSGFARIYRELDGVEGFIFRADRLPWLIAIPFETYLGLIGGRHQR